MMVPATTSLSTIGVPDGQKVSFWTDKLGSLFGPINIDSLNGKTLDAQMDCFTLSRLRLSHIFGTGTRIAVTPSANGGLPRDLMRILFQTEGQSCFEQDGTSIEFGPGDCIAYDYSRPHRFTNFAETTIDSVCIPKHMISRRGLRMDRMPAQKLPYSVMTGVAHDFLKGLLKVGPAIHANAMDDCADALLNLVLLPFADGIQTASMVTHGDLLRARAKSYIDRNLGDPDLTVDGIATALGCTTRYLHRIFHDEGTTVARYLWQSRLDACRQAIEATENRGRSITDLAFSFGFSSSAHFSRVFRQRYGFPPSRLRALSGAASSPL